jgi:hypothetical protein
MPNIMIQLDNKVNKEVHAFMLNNDITSKADACVELIKKALKI